VGEFHKLNGWLLCEMSEVGQLDYFLEDVEDRGLKLHEAIYTARKDWIERASAALNLAGFRFVEPPPPTSTPARSWAWVCRMCRRIWWRACGMRQRTPEAWADKEIPF
jgi:hypothetical protein